MFMIWCLWNKTNSWSILIIFIFSFGQKQQSMAKRSSHGHLNLVILCVMGNVFCCHRGNIPFPPGLKLQLWPVPRTRPGPYDQTWTLATECARFVFVIRLTGSQQQLHTQWTQFFSLLIHIFQCVTDKSLIHFTARAVMWPGDQSEAHHGL